MQVTAGGLAGASAAAITNPLDVVKTRLQLDGIHSPRSVASNHIVRPLTASLSSLQHVRAHLSLLRAAHRFNGVSCVIPANPEYGLAATGPSEDHPGGWQEGLVGRSEGSNFVSHASCSHQLGHVRKLQKAIDPLTQVQCCGHPQRCSARVTSSASITVCSALVGTGLTAQTSRTELTAAAP